MSAAKGSLLFVSVPPEGEEPTLVYRDLQKKVYNNGNQFGDISRFAIPQFKVPYSQVPRGDKANQPDRLGHWTH